MGRPLMPVKLDNYKPLREIVFETLREAIINGDLNPGERIMEVQMAEELGVSRTPVREAIRKLELEGFVVMIPRKGAYVADISLRDVAEVFEIRSALEGLAAELAAERATEDELEHLERLLVKIGEALENNNTDEVIQVDEEFHDVLFSASRNERLKTILSNLREQIHRFRVQSLSRPGRLKVALAEHRAVVEAIAERDPEKARTTAKDHIESAENALMQSYDAKEKRPQRPGR